MLAFGDLTLFEGCVNYYENLNIQHVEVPKNKEETILLLVFRRSFIE
jgi:hypothetical protein